MAVLPAPVLLLERLKTIGGVVVGDPIVCERTNAPVTVFWMPVVLLDERYITGGRVVVAEWCC